MRVTLASSPPAPTLFPVLSVLVSLLGALILIMGGVTSVSIGPGRTVKIGVGKPANDPRQYKPPTYLEWDGQGLTLHPDRTVVPVDLARTTLSEDEIAAVVRETPDEPEADVTKLYWKRVDAKFEALFAGTPIANLIAATKGGSSTYHLVLLVRPSGFDNFIPLRNFLIRRGVDVGYEPIEQRYGVRVD